ncbi:hypothetical protein ACX80O_02040 [Arthrobacter sp. Hz1]
MTAEPGPEHRGHLVTGCEVSDASAYRLDDASDIHSQDGLTRPKEAECEACEDPEAGGHVAGARSVIGRADGARVTFTRALLRVG